VATSGRGTGRSRPRDTAGPARSRPQSRRARGPQARGPASARRGTPGRPAPQRPRLTGRAAIVIVVLALLLVSYAGSLRAFLAQRSHINDLEAEIAADKQAVAELREEQRRWTDEAFIEAQARERFGWVMPGEVGFRVIGKNGRPLDAPSQLTDPTSLGRDPDVQWWSATLGSVRGAGAKESGGPGPARRLGPPVHKPDRAGQDDRPDTRRGH
jgi:cell division protein FtsB